MTSKKTETKKTETKKTETKKTETKKTVAKKPFWDGRSRTSNDKYRENYNSIFKQRKNFRNQGR